MARRANIIATPNVYLPRENKGRREKKRYMALIETDCCTPAINIMTGLQHFPFFFGGKKQYIIEAIRSIHQYYPQTRQKVFFFWQTSIWAGASSFSRFFKPKIHFSSYYILLPPFVSYHSAITFLSPIYISNNHRRCFRSNVFSGRGEEISSNI